MKKAVAAIDDRQGVIPIDLPPGPRLSSDDKARSELLAIIETLATAKSTSMERATARMATAAVQRSQADADATGCGGSIRSLRC